MLEYLIAPLALVGFLMTWAVAEESTVAREAARPVPQPEPVVTPQVTPKRKGWIF